MKAITVNEEELKAMFEQWCIDVNYEEGMNDVEYASSCAKYVMHYFKDRAAKVIVHKINDDTDEFARLAKLRSSHHPHGY